MYFIDVRTSLAIGYGDGQLNDEEFILLYDAFKSQNPVYPYWKFNRFCLEDLESSECEAMFRGHMVKHGLDWTSKTWTGPLVKHGLDSKAPISKTWTGLV